MPLRKALFATSISAVAGVAMFFAGCLGLGGALMLFYWATAFNHKLEPYFVLATLIGLLLVVFYALAVAVLLFKRLNRVNRPDAEPLRRKASA